MLNLIFVVTQISHLLITKVLSSTIQYIKHYLELNRKIIPSNPPHPPIPRTPLFSIFSNLVHAAHYIGDQQQ